MNRGLALHVITTTEVGGAETQLLRLVEALPAWRHAVAGLGPAGALAPRLAAAGAEVHSLDLAPGPGALLAGTWALAKLMRAKRPTVVQSWMYHADLLAAMAAPLAGSPPLCWGVRCSDMDLSLYGAGTRLTVRACAALAGRPAAIAANSAAGAEYHAGLGYPRRHMVVVPNGFDTARFAPDPAAGAAARAELGIPAQAPVIGLCARLDPMKDHAGFLAAAARLAAQRADTHFLLLGLGVEPGAPGLEAAGDPPLAGRCHLLGRRPDPQRWYNAMDLHVSASAFGEGLSNAVGEAMACGLPGVVTAVGDSAALLGGAGRVVPPREPAALAAALAELLALPAGERAGLGRAARERIEAEYSLAAMAARYDELWRGVVEVKRG